MWSGPPGRRLFLQAVRKYRPGRETVPVDVQEAPSPRKTPEESAGPPDSTCMTRSPASRFTPALLRSDSSDFHRPCITRPTYGCFTCPLAAISPPARVSVEAGIVIGLPRSKPLVFRPRTLPATLTSAPPEKPGYNVRSGRMNCSIRVRPTCHSPDQTADDSGAGQRFPRRVRATASGEFSSVHRRCAAEFAGGISFSASV